MIASAGIPMDFQLLRPPYLTLEAFDRSNVHTNASLAPRASIIVLRPASGASWASTAADILECLRRYPTHALAVNVSALQGNDRLRFVSSARVAHVPGFIDEEAPDADLLRRLICDSSDLDQRILHWLRLQGFDIDPEVAQVVRLLVNHSMNLPFLMDLPEETPLWCFIGVGNSCRPTSGHYVAGTASLEDG